MCIIIICVLIQTQSLGFHSILSDSVGLVAPSVCISSKFPGGPDATSEGSYFENHWYRQPSLRLSCAWVLDLEINVYPADY